MGFKSKSKTEDVLFSDCVRVLAGWKCVRCKRQHEPYQNTMDCSHFWGRGNHSVRFDFENADALCRYPCHQGKDSFNPDKLGWEYKKQIVGQHGCEFDGEYTAYKKKQLGERGFDLLMLRAHVSQKFKIDKKELRIVLRAKLVGLNDKVLK